MNKKIYIIDTLLIVVSLIGIMFLVGYSQPLVIAPVDNLETTNSSVLFEFGNANEILIDDNIQFSSPEIIYAKDNLIINLKPGKYYWKLKGVGESEVRTLTIISEVELKLRKSKGGYEVVNAGNTLLDVDVYSDGELKERVVLDVDDVVSVSGSKFVGGMR